MFQMEGSRMKRDSQILVAHGISGSARLNQAVHGDREHGFIMSRMRISRKVVVGFWQEKMVQRLHVSWFVDYRAPTTPIQISGRFSS
jgi:hypothetical protein